jgi:hypothetical protein
MAFFGIPLYYYSLYRVSAVFRAVEGVDGFSGLATHGDGRYVTDFVLIQNLENRLGTEALVQKYRRMRIFFKSSGTFLRTILRKAFGTCSERIVRVILTIWLSVFLAGDKEITFKPFRELKVK